MHPRETVLGMFHWGDTVDVVVEPFRACLVMVSTQEIPGIGFHGCEGEIIKDKAGEDAVVKLYGLPGTSSTVKLAMTITLSPGLTKPETPRVGLSGTETAT